MKTISTSELKELIKKDPETIIIDVRTQGEFLMGHIKTARNIPLNEITSIENENISKDKNLYVICRSGARSAFACQHLEKMGYNNSFNVTGGMGAWEN